MPGSQGAVSLPGISTRISEGVKSMSALLGLWLFPLACKYSKDLQEQRVKQCQQGGKYKTETTDKLSDPPYHTKRKQQQDLHSFPCSWYLWSWIDTRNTSSSSQLWKEFLPNGSGKKGEVAALPSGPVNYPNICTGSLACAVLEVLHTYDGTTGCVGTGVV